MKGHVARKRDRYYAVIYEGLDPIDGKEKKSWHAAGTDRAEAEALAARLAADRDGRNDEVRALSFGAYLSGRWLPAKKLELRTSTAATSTRPNATSCPPSAASSCGGCGPRTSNASTSRCCNPPTASGPCHPRRSTKCTSSSAARSITPCAEGS